MASQFLSPFNRPDDVPYSPDFSIATEQGLIDPRQRMGLHGKERSYKGKHRYGEKYKPMTPGEELEIRGFNQIQDARRRGKRQREALFAAANQTGLSESLARVRKETGEGMDVSEASLGRRQQGLGLQLTERQKRGQTRRLGLTRSLAQAQASDATRQGSLQQASTAKRGAVGLESQLSQARQASYTALGNAEGQRHQQAEADRVADEGDKMAAVGQVAGLIAMFASSEHIKHDKRKTSGLLDRLKNIRVEKWKYNGDEKVDHIGPYAEEFNDTFGVGQADRGKIAVIDMLGVTLGAVKELSEQVNAST